MYVSMDKGPGIEHCGIQLDGKKTVEYERLLQDWLGEFRDTCIWCEGVEADLSRGYNVIYVD